MVWLGHQHGYLSDWITQQWVRFTGKPIVLDPQHWLAGPTGSTSGIGKTFFTEYAPTIGLIAHTNQPNSGLIANFDQLAWEGLNPAGVHPAVRHFYEHTVGYDLDAWAQWSGLFRPFGWLLALLFSRRLQQLNVPLSGLDTSLGMTSDIVQLVEPETKRVRYTAWVRQLVGTGNVLYAGSYSLCHVPGYPGVCIKVVFPLPNGNAVVIMKPEVYPDGAFRVTSAGRTFGDPGFYFTVHQPNGQASARYVSALQEYIHVYAATDACVRAEHVLKLWGFPFLRLHYRLRRQVLATAT